MGIQQGDRIATLLHNSAGAVVTLHAALRAGATLVPLNIRSSANELAWQLDDCKARLLIADDRTREMAAQICADSSAVKLATVERSTGGTIRLVGDISDDSAEADLHLLHDPNSILAIIYTSGTTGRPKGAMLTVGNFWWSAIGSALNIGASIDDRWLICLPMFHVGGLSIACRAAIGGFAAIVHNGFDPEAVNSSIDNEGVTVVSVVAVMLQRMLDARSDKPYAPSLRCVLLGGGPAPRPLLERCAALGIPVVQTYGLTETTSQISTLAPEDAIRKLGSAGRPLYPNELRIASPDGSSAPVGEAGEILVRGPVLMAGYNGQPEAMQEAIVDGWLHTGDVGHLDGDGYLYVLDRRDDLIITGGENVYPAEVEAALLSHPAVSEAGVFGLSDSEWGQRVVAVLRTSEPVSKEEIIGHCRSLLAHYKAPGEIRFAAEPLPRTAAGKLRRSVLRDEAEAQQRDQD
jgi:O-succinylbenzoic acid--CoA ligase